MDNQSDAACGPAGERELIEGARQEARRIEAAARARRHLDPTQLQCVAAGRPQQRILLPKGFLAVPQDG